MVNRDGRTNLGSWEHVNLLTNSLNPLFSTNLKDNSSTIIILAKASRQLCKLNDSHTSWEGPSLTPSSLGLKVSFALDLSFFGMGISYNYLSDFSSSLHHYALNDMHK